MSVVSESDPPSLFGGYFNLHPNDAALQVEQCTRFLSAFTEAFKERIEVEIEYSRQLLRVSRLLKGFVTPRDPSPVSFIASAFKVEHEERARHALELADYLHSQVEAPCMQQAQEAEEELRKAERQLRAFYKQGQAVEEAYQKHLKRYYRTHQEWEERMIAKHVLAFTPGATQNQKEKAQLRMEEERRQHDQHRQKYLQGLQSFNNFAKRFNSSIGGVIGGLQRVEVGGLALQADSIRKLIVSEINMFKNVEYDLLNISRQMEAVSPNSQIEAFVAQAKDDFRTPIISIYAEGPVGGRYQAIDLKAPICGTLLEESLLRIDKGVFYWLLDNKTNSTLKYALEQLMLRQEGAEGAKEEVEGEYLTELEGTIASNKSVRLMPTDGPREKQELLRGQEVYSNCLELTTAVAQLLREGQRRDSLLQLVESHLSTHHFYRFVTYAALNAYQDQHEQRVAGDAFPLLLKLLLQRSLAAKDVFVARLSLTLLFSVAYLAERPLFCFQFEPVRSLECWESRDFWQAAIFESAFEASTLLPSIERSYLKDVYLMRQKNVVFSALATYCHYMVMLGAEVQEVKLVMARFAHIYNLTEEHEADLGKTIATSLKQLAQIQEQ